MENTIKTMRNNLNLTQKELSEYLGVSLRTVQKWDQGVRTPSDWVINLIMDKLTRFTGLKNKEASSKEVLEFTEIKKVIAELAHNYDISNVILFGSYVKGTADELSDVDLYIDSELSGLDFYALLEKLKFRLGRNVDLLSKRNLDVTSNMYKEIMSTGVVIYEG